MAYEYLILYVTVKVKRGTGDEASGRFQYSNYRIQYLVIDKLRVCRIEYSTSGVGEGSLARVAMAVRLSRSSTCLFLIEIGSQLPCLLRSTTDGPLGKNFPSNICMRKMDRNKLALITNLANQPAIGYL